MAVTLPFCKMGETRSSIFTALRCGEPPAVNSYVPSAVLGTQ